MVHTYTVYMEQFCILVRGGSERQNHKFSSSKVHSGYKPSSATDVGVSKHSNSMD